MNNAWRDEEEAAAAEHRARHPDSVMINPMGYAAALQAMMEEVYGGAEPDSADEAAVRAVLRAYLVSTGYIGTLRVEDPELHRIAQEIREGRAGADLVGWSVHPMSGGYVAVRTSAARYVVLPSSVVEEIYHIVDGIMKRTGVQVYERLKADHTEEPAVAELEGLEKPDQDSPTALETRIEQSVAWYLSEDSDEGARCPVCGGPGVKACNWCVACEWRPMSYHLLEAYGRAELVDDPDRPGRIWRLVEPEG